MILVFGKKLCSACQEKKKELDKKRIPYIYYDLDTPDGLMEAAARGILKDDIELPIIIET